MPICIAGMHRSGTSMIARALNLCGLYLGDKEQIRRFGEDNVEGYWENEYFVDLDERLLAALDSAWDLPPQAPAGWEQADALEPFRAEARRLVESFADREPWGWKDPRSALLLPFWKSVIPGLRTVVCVREPVEVALSLNRRGLSSLRFGQRLWEEHYRQIVAHTTASDRLVTRYETCLRQPEDECRRLASFAGLPLADEAPRSMKPALRHHVTWRDAPGKLALPPSTQDLYDALEREALLVPIPGDVHPRPAVVEAPRLETTVHVDFTRESPIIGSTADLEPIQRGAASAIYNATTSDPQFILNLPPFPPSSVRAVRFRMRRATTEPAVAQLFWTHSPEEAFSEHRSAVAVLEPGTAGWCEYRFWLDRPPVRERWMAGSTIVRLRFDPANIEGRLELESLALEA